MEEQITSVLGDLLYKLAKLSLLTFARIVELSIYLTSCVAGLILFVVEVACSRQTSIVMSYKNAVLGSIFLFVVLICLPLHLVIFTVLMKKQEFQKLTAYRVMTHMSVLECVYMTGHILSGLMSICETSFSVHVERIGGCFISSGWVGIVAFTFILSLNRFMVFANIKLRPDHDYMFFTTFITLIWLLTTVVFGLHLIPQMSFSYSVKLNAYIFADGPVARDVEHVMYRNQSSSVWKIRSGEIKLFVQSVIIFLYLSLIRCLWHFGKVLITSDVGFTILGIATQAVGGLNPILYLTFNKTIRKHVMDMFGVKRTAVQVITDDMRTK
ncbi:hypothetical protein L596_026530 [Steinernema carpocapsae]|uniref:G-protein coupled receptors family 1 profile domain-containing protein n=1 Tax=Steinernema carpocapsae TaxID=34508 RepID=A0A4U5M1Q1_STECR|nr:hypothetical protein L596_026530 [Steinernema carpocapsae]